MPLWEQHSLPFKQFWLRIISFQTRGGHNTWTARWTKEIMVQKVSLRSMSKTPYWGLIYKTSMEKFLMAPMVLQTNSDLEKHHQDINLIIHSPNRLSLIRKTFIQMLPSFKIQIWTFYSLKKFPHNRFTLFMNAGSREREGETGRLSTPAHACL